MMAMDQRRIAPKMAPRVLISGHFVYAGRVGGAEHMAYNLTRGLDDAGADVTFLCADKSNIAADFLAESNAAGRTVLECGGGGARFISEQRACWDKRLSGDAILFPNYFLPPIHPARLGPAAVVIHDFQYRHFPEHFSAKKRAWLRLSHGRALAQADTVIMISQFVRQDAIRLYGASAERAVVIPNPISWERFGRERGPHPFGNRPYVLSVAAQYPHKGLDLLIRAFAELAAKRPEPMLVLAGQLPEQLVSVGKDTGGLREQIVRLGLSDRVRVTGYIDDRTLGDLYHHAAMFAFPSIFEGFGMPPIEALGFGVPTLTTRCSALPETTLGLATLADDPRDPSEWAERMEAMLSAPRLAPADIDTVRRHYSPKTIGGRYLQAMVGGAPVRNATLARAG
jgi:glycosyltransferase involved in cell wall biosynthesis